MPTIRFTRALMTVLTIGVYGIFISEWCDASVDLAVPFAGPNLYGATGTKPFVADGRAPIGEGGLAAAGQVAREKAVANALLKAVTELKGPEWVAANNEVLGAEILFDPASFLVGSPKAKPAALDPKTNEAVVTVSATVDMTALRKAVEALGSDASKVRYPRVLVAVTEEIVRRPAPDPAAETAIKDTLAEAGIPVVDPTGMDDVRRRKIADALKQGDTDAADGLEKEFGCEMILVGQAFAEETAPQLGMTRCEARVEVKAYYADTAQLVCAKSATAIAIRPGVLVAGKESLRAAGEKVGKQILDSISTGRTTLLQVHVTGCRSFTWLTQIEKVLQDIQGVNTVERRTADIPNGVAAWDLAGPGATAEAVSVALDQCPSPRLQITEQTAHAVNARVVD